MADVTDLPTRVRHQDIKTRNKPGTRVKAAVRRQQVIRMLLAGATEAEIAQALAISRSRVNTLTLQILDDWESAERANVDRVRALQLAKLDRLERAHFNNAVGVAADGTATQPSIKAADLILRIEALRARIAGTEAAKKVEFSGSLGFHLDRAEIEADEAAWAATGGDIVEGTAREITSG